MGGAAGCHGVAAGWQLGVFGGQFEGELGGQLG